MPFDSQVLILGGGLSGCLIAAGLADRGVRVSIVEQRDGLMSAASRWNDGKIHLGYTFTGTSSIATAALMQEGGAVFLDGMERALGTAIPEEWFGTGVVYLVDHASMVDADVLWDRAKRVGRRHDEQALSDPGMRRYLEGQPRLERLPVELAAMLTRQGDIAAAWRTPERHLATGRVADALAAAVLARGVEVVRGAVAAVKPAGPGWRVALADGAELSAPVVVNCLWENRAVIDKTVRPSCEPLSIRYKRALFGRGVTAVDGVASSTRILGPYGDVVAYGNGDAYLSWYPAGLVAKSDDGSPPSVPMPRIPEEADAILAGLGLAAETLEDPGADWQLRGGYVVAWGYGDIDRIDSPLHERHRPAVAELEPGFISVDTGKYTLGPLLATRAAAVADQALRAPPRSSTAFAPMTRIARSG